MREIVIQRVRVNIEGLDADLRTLLGEAFYGISANRQGVIVHLAESVDEDTLMQVEAQVIAHDPDLLTDSQRTRRDRRIAIEQARRDYITPLDPADFPDALPVIRALIRRIAWLEREIRDLRGL